MTQVLVIADAHIGRYPSKVPVNQDELTVRAVWNAAIDYALEHPVHAVVLTGDIVDKSNKYFEAYGPVKHGVRTLTSAGIEVFAVAGNHDYDVFPRLASEVSQDRFHLLGHNGTWETKPLIVDGRVAAWFMGWSFPSLHCSKSPLETLQLPSKSEPIVGIVHGEVSESGSQYAPLSLETLQRLPVAAWLLGHVHKPQCYDGSPPVLYPGSLQPLDPGEAGAHGPWMLNIDRQDTVSVTQVKLASVRYEKVAIDVGKATDIKDIESAITARVSREAGRLQSENEQLRHAVLRVNLTGRTALHRELITRSWSDTLDKLVVPMDTLQVTVDTVECNTTPARNLDNIARFTDPPGTLARWILELRLIADGAAVTPTPKCKSLLSAARDELARVQKVKNYQDHLAKLDLGTTDLAALLASQGLLLLDALMSQRDNAQK